MYKVKLEQFEGPLDLLLELIEAKKLPLIGLALARVAGEFMEYIKTLKNRNTEELVQFLVIASRLVLLKSRELVPSDEPEESEGSLEELERQLVLYQPFRRAARELGHLDRNAHQYFGREAFQGFEGIFYFPRQLKTAHLTERLGELLGSIALPARIPQARLSLTISVEKCIRELKKFLARKKEIDFSQYLKALESEEQIANFLGMLELVRMGEITAQQKSPFATIVLYA